MKNIALFAAAAGLCLNLSVCAADDPALMEPVKSVYDHYLKIEKALVADSTKGVADEAGAIAKAVRGDTMKMLPVDVADKADAVAAAKDLPAARSAFKKLSQPLIQYLAEHKVQSGLYHEAYCPMARASWLQDEKSITNPYFGQSMLSCGELKRNF